MLSSAGEEVRNQSDHGSFPFYGRVGILKQSKNCSSPAPIEFFTITSISCQKIGDRETLRLCNRPRTIVLHQLACFFTQSWFKSDSMQNRTLESLQHNGLFYCLLFIQILPTFILSPSGEELSNHHGPNSPLTSLNSFSFPQSPA